MRILLVEDHVDISNAIREIVKERYGIDCAFNAEEAWTFLEANNYDVIILDINLPDENGINLCRQIRENRIMTPILMLTASSEVNDKVNSLDSGADDFLSKPFDPAELLARLRALTRRSTTGLIDNVLTVGDIELDIGKGTAIRRGKKLDLRRKEFLLLEYFMRNAGQIVTRNMLLEHVWDNQSDPLTNTVDVHIKFLRDKVDKPFRTNWIKTIHGMGYKLDITNPPKKEKKRKAIMMEMDAPLAE